VSITAAAGHMNYTTHLVEAKRLSDESTGSSQVSPNGLRSTGSLRLVRNLKLNTNLY
jgi:hypothetical protein